ncbi:ROK family transcriptional regulator [Deinococcus sp. KSM4-11]|uniref:ROK family transcriptional regulator n=1 Tax=Deinococcus sp. KSM4-11 TaxID=2568654 RepID=UPI0010A2B51B|nr:ROK family transcriptional regulator [Deinococcus sp. KSM4-11]THF85550.1 ROK family transcriptional regulator [Deinococcus sp. KSM4-11]
MRSLRGNDQSVVRVLNRNAIFNTLHREGPLSRVQLKERSGLSGAAITGVVGDLMRDGLVEEREGGVSSGGRPPVLLAVNYRARSAVGIKLMERRLEAVLTNLGGEVQRHLQVGLPDHRPETVVRTVQSAVEALLTQSGTRKEQLMGLGMGLPGVIDDRRGVCVHSDYLQWHEVPIGALLEEAVGVPIALDNDVNAFAVAERLFGHGKATSNLIVITVGRGIGAGLVANGQLVRGRDGGAGEFGHVVSETGGRRCECGKAGCLEAYASEPALVARARELASDLEITQADDLLHHLDDPRIAGLLRDAGQRIGIQLANLVNLLNPELIVVGGEGVRFGDPLFTPMREALREHSFASLAVDLPVVIEPWGDEVWARGAASLAVSHAFDLDLQEDACTSAD